MRKPEFYQPILPILGEETATYTQLHSLEEAAQTGERSSAVTLSMNEVDTDIADVALKQALWRQFGVRTAPHRRKVLQVIADSQGRLSHTNDVRIAPLRLYPEVTVEE